VEGKGGRGEKGRRLTLTMNMRALFFAGAAAGTAAAARAGGGRGGGGRPAGAGAEAHCCLRFAVAGLAWRAQIHFYGKLLLVFMLLPVCICCVWCGCAWERACRVCRVSAMLERQQAKATTLHPLFDHTAIFTPATQQHQYQHHHQALVVVACLLL